MASSKDEDAAKAGCLLIIGGFIIVGLTLGWQVAFGVLGICIVLVGLVALLRT